MSTRQLEKCGSIWLGQFRAMASPCEIHMELRSQRRAAQLLALAEAEALRIERLFSRYRDDNVIHQINQANGQPVSVDAETARMLDFAEHCFELSDGLFDITSGVLREAWQFDGSDDVPSQEQVAALLPRVGWQRVCWKAPVLIVPPGMQIDLGGIGKEYAVDRVAGILQAQFKGAFLINFGGDLQASKAPTNSDGWTVGIESSRKEGVAQGCIRLVRGALATSGDARRYLEKDGVRYSHVLNPLTGWPVVGAPTSVTVAGNACTEAGILSTLALLQGEHAETFLDEHGVDYWLQRSADT